MSATAQERRHRDGAGARLAEIIRREETALAARMAERHLREEVIAEVAAEGFSDVRAEYRDSYLRPLLKLLAGCLGTGDPRYEAIYLDERIRFLATVGRGPATGGDDTGILGRLLSDDEQQIVEVCGADGLSAAMLQELERVHAPLRTAGEDTVKLLMVGDCLMTEVRAFAAAYARRRAVEIDARHLYFSAREGIGLSTDEVTRAVERNPPDLIALSFLTFEGVPAYRALLRGADVRRGRRRNDVDHILVMMHDFIERVRQATSATILLHGACGLPLTPYRRRLPILPALSRRRNQVLAALNAEIQDLAEGSENVVFIDEREMCAHDGLRRASAPIIPRSLVPEAMFHASGLGALLGPIYADIAAARASVRGAKVLLVDFDNTLWQGVMAEGPVVHDHARQRLLRDLREAGMLLVSLSKNSEDAIRWNEMALTRDDFVLHKVSWNQKAQSVLEAAEQLNLGPDSFILIDDNPAERQLVSHRLPKVRTLDANRPETWAALTLALRMPETGSTEEAARRTQMYREAAARREALAEPLELDSMMESLELRAEFYEAASEDIPRLHELIARTNQFNTTTQRRSEAQLRALLTDEDYHVYLTTLADKFGALGVVGVVVVRREEDTIEFDSVVMSCRAMGFGLEYVMLREALEAEQPWQQAVGRYEATPRNGPCSQLFESAGFEERDGQWILSSTDESVSAPSWIAVSRRGIRPRTSRI